MLLLLLTSCEDLLKVDLPSDRMTTESVFENDADALKAITGIYSNMMLLPGFFSGGEAGASYLLGLSSDEMFLYSNNKVTREIADNTISEDNSIVLTRWKELYRIILHANAILEGVNKSTKLSGDIKRKLCGNARLMRAFCYFYLTNLYGNVPLLLVSKPEATMNAPRVIQKDVYAQIVRDLKEAQSLLDDEYSGSAREWPNKVAATALLARVWRYTKEYKSADSTATIIINNDQFELMPLDKVFLRNSREAIWQLEISNKYTWEGAAFILTELPSHTSSYGRNATITTSLLNSFEAGDTRCTTWINSIIIDGMKYTYPYKYRKSILSTVANESIVVLRLAELYLIRAEARIQLNDITGGITDLNTLRKRARATPTITIPDPLPDLPLKSSKEQALLAVENERRHEFFAEFGHRWFDLNRTNRANTVLSVIKTNWQPTDQLWPVPQSEILLNKNLKPQNPGYKQ